MKKLVLFIAVAVLLIVPSAAADVALQDAQRAAISYWGSSPCHHQVMIKYVNPSRYSEDLAVPLPNGFQIAAQTSFNAPDGALDYNDPPSTYTDCVIWLNDQMWPQDEETNWIDFCALVVHEYGHLEGYPDVSTDSPTSITYQNITAANDDIPACTKLAPKLSNERMNGNARHDHTSS